MRSGDDGNAKRRDAGITTPRRDFGLALRIARKLAVFAILLVLGAVFLGLIAMHWLPDGLRLAGPATHEGLLHLDEGGTMRFTRAERLRENERLRPLGRQKSEIFCVEAPSHLRRAMTEAAKALPPERIGGRALWVRVAAERRLGRSSCSRSRSLRGSRRGRLEDILRIASIQSMRPLGCDSLLFRAGDLTCPKPPVAAGTESRS